MLTFAIIRYILHQASGPFLSYVHAHYDIAFACITYLNTSSCFHDRSVSVDDLRIQVAKGFHGLHPYANEFWLQHLFQYTKCGANLDSPHYSLESGLEELLLAFWKMQPGSAAKIAKFDDTTTVDDIRNKVEALGDNPWLQRMGIDIMTFRAYLSREKFAHQDADGESSRAPRHLYFTPGEIISVYKSKINCCIALETRELKIDPTYFSETSQQYQSIVRFLLDCSINDLPRGLTQVMLNDFKSIYTDSAFLCRYLDCPRHSNGFSSAAKRNEHESSHAKPLRCSDSSCEFFARGFNTKSGLFKHNRRYHPSPEEKDPPKFELRKEAPVIPSSPSPPPQPPPPPVQPLTFQRPKSSVSHVPTTMPATIQESVVKRMSRAKKGLKVHNCNLCPKIYTRAEGLRQVTK